MLCCLPCRDDANIAVALSKDDAQHLVVEFSQRDKADFAIIAAGVYGLQDGLPEDLGGLQKLDAVLGLIRGALVRVPLKHHSFL